jgi:LysR family transcriptional regulator for metE and metH
MSRLTVEVRDLELVEALASCGGLARAAERLHVSASALSHQLRQLEERLGVALFVRTPRHMTPTSAGERLLRAVIPVLHELRRAEDEIGIRDSERRGVLRICVERYPSYLWLPEMIPAFRQRFPGVDLRVVPRTAGVIDALHDHEVDLAIVSGPGAPRTVASAPLFRDEMVVVMASRQGLASKEYIEPADLSAVSTMAAPGERCPGWPEWTARIPFVDFMLELVRHDLGVGLLPMWIAGPALQTGGVVARRLTCQGTFREWFVAYRDDDTPGYVSTFVEALVRRPPSVRSHFGVRENGAPLPPGFPDAPARRLS